MADILRVTTPLVNKSQMIDPSKNLQNIPQFNLQDITKVAPANSQTELLMQNNGLDGQEKTSELLLDLLKDPSVTVNFLKNISLLQEVIRLLPANNEALTGEIEQMFDLLFLLPEDLTGEMVNQEGEATRFRGDLFTVLRELLDQNPESRPLRQSVVDLLKTLNLYTNRKDVLDAVANSLEFLSKSLAPSRALSEKLLFLSAQFRGPESGAKFESLKAEVQSLFRDVEESILFSPKIAKILSLTVYNLSRFGGDEELLQKIVEEIANKLPTEELRNQFVDSVIEFLNTPERKGSPEVAKEQSKVLSLLTKIIDKQTDGKTLMTQGFDQVDKIIQSLLSSPCNFTPLLHYVLPLQYQEIQSFMEMWINPNGEEDDPLRAAEGDSIHMLMVFDIGSLGRFELELYVRGKVIDAALFCPPDYAEVFAAARKDLTKCVQGLDYKFGDVRIDRLERSRSLMEVFRSLPQKRAGIDVKV